MALTPAPLDGAVGTVARAVSAGRGWAWWREAWLLFRRAPGLWIVLLLIVIILAVLLVLIPLVGQLALSLLTPPLAASWVLAARKLDQGGTLEVGDLALGFQQQLSSLLVLGALTLAASLVIGLLAGILGAGVGLMVLAGGMTQSAATVLAAAGSVMAVVLVVLIAALIFGMAFWFAPALVVLGGATPVAALKASFGACLKNVGPLLVYVLAYIGLALVASIPLGLGWIILLPVGLITLYTSYRDVFGA